MDPDIDTIISADSAKFGEALEGLLSKSANVYKFPELDRGTRRQDLWKSIYDVAKSSKDPTVTANCFAAIRILSRDKTNLNSLVTDEWLELIKAHSGLHRDELKLDDREEKIAVEAFKCLCNIIFNCPVSVLACVKNGTLNGIMHRLKSYSKFSVSYDLKYFDTKVLFLITALNVEIRHKLRDEMHGLKYLIEALDLILKEATCNEPLLNDKYVDITCEILKTLFNLTVQQDGSDEEEEVYCTELVKLLRKFLIVPTENEQKQYELRNHIINLLLNVPNNCLKTLVVPVDVKKLVEKTVQFEKQDMTAIYMVLMFLQNKFSAEPTVSKQHELLSPVLTLLLKCATTERAMRKYLRLQILPPLRDVRTRPEQGNTLRNSLCRLLTSPITQVKDLAAELLFVLCKQNVGRMIKYTGYGNAAGLFANRGLLGGRNSTETSLYSSDSGNSDTEEYKELKHGINPVMGCYDPPHANPTANMTEEQKEYEAMKLVELMDNMTRQGVVRPCKIGEDGRPEPIEHVLQLQQGLRSQQVHLNSDSD